MTALRRGLGVSIAVLCVLAGTAAAAPHVRTGLCAGVGFGIESVSWTDPDGGREVEGSGSGNARIGYAVKPGLVLGVEFWGWAKEYEFSTMENDTTLYVVPVHVRLSAVNLCATYFPGNAGFFIRLGAGFAYGGIEVSPPSAVTTVAASDKSDTGIAVNIAPGYEWRLSKRFALGAQGDVVYFGLQNSLENVFGYGVNAQFNWYW